MSENYIKVFKNIYDSSNAIFQVYKNAESINIGKSVRQKGYSCT